MAANSGFWILTPLIKLEKSQSWTPLIKLGSAHATPLFVAGAVRSKAVILLLLVVVNGDKVSFVLSSFAIISQRERKREGWGLFALLLLYYMNCFNVCFLFMLHVFNASSSLCHGMVCGL